MSLFFVFIPALLFLSSSGDNTAVKRYGPTFTDYLTATAGQKFNPPIKFQSVQIPDLNTFSMVNQEVDFAFANGGVAACNFRAGNGAVSPIVTQTTGENGLRPFLSPPPR